jgi:hypothetical protein
MKHRPVGEDGSERDVDVRPDRGQNGPQEVGISPASKDPTYPYKTSTSANSGRPSPCVSSAQFERRRRSASCLRVLGQFTSQPSRRATTTMTAQNISDPSQTLVTDTQPEVQHIRVQAPGRWFKSLPALAGIGYGVAWLAGLAAWPSNLAIDASKREIVSLYAAHMSQAATQYLVVEGLAGALLGIVLFYSIRRVSRCDPTWTSRVAVAAGVVVAISLLQSLLGLFLVSSASKGHLSQSGAIYQLINRLDGVKQLLLGACVVILSVLLRTTSNYPQKLMRTTVIVGIALVLSGLAYLLLWNALAGTTFVSLPLLICWVAGTGIWLGAESQSGLGAGRARVGGPGSAPMAVSSGARCPALATSC